MELLARQKRILVLDNENRIQPIVDEIEIYGDYDLVTIYDSNAVYDRARVFKPDLILMDYMLLDGNCILVCDDLKQDTELQAVPIIIVTAYKTKIANKDLFNCDALFIKPLDIRVLASKMDYLMTARIACA